MNRIARFFIFIDDGFTNFIVFVFFIGIRILTFAFIKNFVGEEMRELADLLAFLVMNGWLCSRIFCMSLLRSISFFLVI